MPGKRNSASTWTEAFTELSSVQIAGGIREPKDASGGKGIGFSTEGLVHPIVSYFTAPVPRRFFAAPRFWRVHDLKPTSDAGVLLRLADGTPAMIEHTLGRGSVITTAFPCEKAWSDLPLRPVFLMLMRRTIQYASLGNRPQLNVQVNETARLPITVHQAGSGVRWRDPRGGTGTLNPAESAGGALALELADTRFSGFYRLEGQEWRTWVAANPPAAESDSRPLTSEEALARCQPAHAYWVGSGEAVAVMCLIAETLLVLLWTPKRA
jgi:hypothetical protein